MPLETKLFNCFTLANDISKDSKSIPQEDTSLDLDDPGTFCRKAEYRNSC
jgi:hypothetical protein